MINNWAVTTLYSKYLNMNHVLSCFCHFLSKRGAPPLWDVLKLEIKETFLCGTPLNLKREHVLVEFTLRGNGGLNAFIENQNPSTRRLLANTSPTPCGWCPSKRHPSGGSKTPGHLGRSCIQRSGYTRGFREAIRFNEGKPDLLKACGFRAGDMHTAVECRWMVDDFDPETTQIDLSK